MKDADEAAGLPGTPPRGPLPDALPGQPLVDLVEVVADQLLLGVGDLALVRFASVLEGGVVDAIPA